MQAIEFSTENIKDNVIQIPDKYQEALKGKAKVKVIILFDGEENGEWEELAAGEFLNGYAKEDSIYDKL